MTNPTANSTGRTVFTAGGTYIEGDVYAHEFIAGNKHIYLPPEPFRPLHQLPAPPADFTGRSSELEQLLADIEQGGVTITGLRGMGGIGKTALALVLADRLKAHYPDAQIYLDLKGTSAEPLTPAQAMGHVIRAFHPTAQMPETDAELHGLYQSVLHGQRALLLMDNAAERAQIEPLLCPACCFLLVTSRRQFTLPGLEQLDLNTLLEPDARALLLRIAPRIGDLAPTLAQACGCLPLALRLAGSALAERKNLTPQDYLRRLTEGRERFDDVDASFNLSYELLTDSLRRLWRALAVFPDTFYADAAAAVWRLDEDPTHDALGELLRYSLLQWHEESKRYRLHDLARAFAVSRLEQEEHSAAQQRHAAYFAKVLALANECYHQRGDSILEGLAIFDLERSNIQTGQAWAADNLDSNESAPGLCTAYTSNNTCLALRFHPIERIRWLETSVEASRILDDRRVEGNHLGSLGAAYSDLGQMAKAIDHYQQALDIAREIRAECTPGTPEWAAARFSEDTSLGNLGQAYRDLGDAQKAIEYCERALDIAQEIRTLSTEGSPTWTQARSSEGFALGNLGNVYSDLGDAQRAIDCTERALTIAQEIGDRRYEGIWRGDLASTYSDLGQKERAIEHYQQALVISREIGDRKIEATHLGNLGNAYAVLAKGTEGVQRAIEHLRQALDIDREIGYRRAEANHLGNLGNAYAVLGQVSPAIQYYQQALAISREIGDRSGEAIQLYNLAPEYYTLGYTHQAIDHVQAALTIFEEIKSPYADHAREALAALRQSLKRKKWWQFWK